MTRKSNILTSLACLSLASLPGCATLHGDHKAMQGGKMHDPAMHEAHMAEMMAKMEHARMVAETPEYFQLRPDVEKAYGYTHAVKIGATVIVSGAVSMDDAGNPTAAGDLVQQMKNAYSDLEKVLAHYGYTFDDVVVENVFTTDMAKFLEASAYRSEIYTKQFPTGSWLEVKGLALPEFMIEIELEAHKAPAMQDH